MGSVANLLVRIGLDAGELSSDLAKVNTRLQEAGKSAATASVGFEKLGSTLSSIGTTFSLALSAPLAAFGVSAVKAAGDIEALKLGLNTITRDAKETEVQFKRLVEAAKLPGLGLNEAVQGTIRLQAVGISAQQSERYIRAFGSALAAVGKGRADLDAVLLQLSQLSSKGKVLAQDLKPILERVPQVAKIAQQAFGTVDSEQIQKLGITSRQFVDTIVAGLVKLPQATGGINNAFENLRDSVQQSLAKIGESIVKAIPDFQGKLDAIGNGLVGLADKFAGLPGPVQVAVVALASVAIVGGPTIFVLGQMAQSIVALSTAARLFSSLQLIATFQGISFALSNGLVGALTLGEKAMLGLGTAAIVVGGAIGGWAIGTWIRNITGLGSVVDDLWRKFDPLLQKVGLTTQVLDTQTRAEKDQEFASRKLAEAKQRFAAATNGAVTAVSALDRAMGALGLKSTAALNKELATAKTNLEAVAQSFKKGEASAQDYKNAQDAVAKAAQAVTESQVKLSDSASKRAQAYADADFEALQRAEKYAQNYAAGLAKVQQVDEKSTSLHDTYNRAVIRSDGERLKAHEEYVNKEIKITETLGQRIGLLVGGMIADQSRLREAFKESGADKVVTEESVERAKENFRLIAESGTASAGQLLRAWIAYYDQFLKLQKESGKQVSAEQQKALDDAKKKVEDLGTTTTNTVKKVSALSRQVSTVLTDLSRGIAQAIIQGKSIGDVFKKVAVDIAEAILRIAIEKGLKILIEHLDVVLSKLGSIGKKIADVFGGIASSAGGSAGSAAGGAAGSAGSIGGGGGSAASGVGGVAGAVNLATGVISAVTGVISVFQNAHQETSFNAIEHNTRYAEIRVANIEQQILTYLPELANIHQRLIEISGNTFGGERGISQLILNVDGRRIADALIPYIGRTIQVSVG